MKIVFCIPTITKPHQATLDSLEATIPFIHEMGWDEGIIHEIGCPYISHARATLTRKALDAKADVIIYLDHDISWRPQDMMKLLNTNDDVVAGTYRFKKDEIEYMSAIMTEDNGRPIVREDGCIKAHSVPAGFLKVTENAINKFMTAYPDLCYGKKYNLSVDLFNHGAKNGVWWGEDYAFSRNWRDLGGDIWLIPDMNINHHAGNITYPGNFHEFLLRQPGGSHAIKEVS